MVKEYSYMDRAPEQEVDVHDGIEKTLLVLAHKLRPGIRILRDYDRSEDAVQQALVIAWRELPALRDPDRFEAWLRKLLVRVCYEEAKRARRWDATVLTLLPDEPSRRDDLISLGDRDQLERGFRRLPPEQRAILVMHHYLGLPPADLAETLGIPAGTARSRLHYAHRAMRAALEADARGLPIEEAKREEQA